MVTRRLKLVLRFGAALAACACTSRTDPPSSDPVDASPDDVPIDAAGVPADARPSSDCWPADDAQLRGTIELGTGESGFVPMPDDVQLVFGSQNGFHIVGHARITGLAAGDPDNPLDPANPTTRFRAIFADTGESINPTVTATSCGTRLGYTQAGPGTVFPASVEIRYDVAIAPESIFERDVRVIVEIIDSTSAFARSEKIVTPHQPDNWPP
jgi:hypothetical protein